MGETASPFPLWTRSDPLEALSVKRNLDRFPDDFMFQLTKEEVEALRFQFGSLKRSSRFSLLPIHQSPSGKWDSPRLTRSGRTFLLELTAAQKRSMQLHSILPTTIPLPLLIPCKFKILSFPTSILPTFFPLKSHTVNHFTLPTNSCGKVNLSPTTLKTYWPVVTRFMPFANRFLG